MKKNILIISVTSDIGFSLAQKWLNDGHNVMGTYRSRDENFIKLNTTNIHLEHLDISNKKDIGNFIENIKKHTLKWDTLIMCPATMHPIGMFEKIDFDKWKDTININFTSQMELIHKLLPYKNKEVISSILLFAGSGTNSTADNYSAYTISKIASIKMVELLDSEINDSKFMIYGPGWVKTKIHQETLDSKDTVEDHYHTTLKKLEDNDCTPINTVIESIEWGINLPKKIIGGRNISVVFDKWGQKRLEEELEKNPHMYKLRRYGNDWE